MRRPSNEHVHSRDKGSLTVHSYTIAMDCNELLNPESAGVLLLLFVTPSRTASSHKLIVFVRLFATLARFRKKNR